MTDFHPPITARETEELIAIAHCDDENIWQREATLQAREELIKRNISDDEQLEVLEFWEKQEKALLRSEAERLENNKTESYTAFEMATIYLLAPIAFFQRIDQIFFLRKDQYYLKFWQRLGLLTLGFLTWFFVFYTYFRYEEQQRLEEIEKVDISDWKELHGYD